jgi:hypothetical protein
MPESNNSGEADFQLKVVRDGIMPVELTTKPDAIKISQLNEVANSSLFCRPFKGKEDDPL